MSVAIYSSRMVLESAIIPKTDTYRRTSGRSIGNYPIPIIVKATERVEKNIPSRAFIRLGVHS